MDQAVHDLLSNDVRIVDSTSRTATPEGVSLRFPGHLMPDGKDYVAEAPGKLEPGMLRSWCHQVRSEFNARQDRKDAEEIRAASVSPQGNDAGDSATGKPVPTGAGLEGNGAGSEASLDEYLKAEVAKWARLRARASEDIESLGARIDEVHAKYNEYAANELKAAKTLDFYLNTQTEDLPI